MTRSSSIGVNRPPKYDLGAGGVNPLPIFFRAFLPGSGVAPPRRDRARRAVEPGLPPQFRRDGSVCAAGDCLGPIPVKLDGPSRAADPSPGRKHAVRRGGVASYNRRAYVPRPDGRSDVAARPAWSRPAVRRGAEASAGGGDSWRETGDEGADRLRPLHHRPSRLHARGDPRDSRRLTASTASSSSKPPRSTRRSTPAPLADFRRSAEALGLYLEVGTPLAQPGPPIARAGASRSPPGETGRSPWHRTSRRWPRWAAATPGLYVGDRHDRFRTDVPWEVAVGRDARGASAT